MAEETSPPDAPWWRQLVVLGFLFGLGFLIVRTHVRIDDRWGFSMFRDITVLTADYRWEYPDGRTTAVKFDGVLYGDARMMVSRRRPLDWVLGMGAYRDMAREVVNHLGETQLPEGATGVAVAVRWRMWNQGPWTDETIRWPE